MNLKAPIKILVQTEIGQFSESGIQLSGPQVVGINQETGLIILAQGITQGEQSSAHKCIEIMLDDMALNLPVAADESGQFGSVAVCMSESLENINEYLYAQLNELESAGKANEVELAAIQVYRNSISCCDVGALNCLLFSDNKLSVLEDGDSTDQKLGVDPSFKPAISRQDFNPGDIVLVLSSALLNSLSHEFIRVTLSRFHENLEMALRQINTRAMQNGMNVKPTLVICRMSHPVEERRSWLGKLKK